MDRSPVFVVVGDADCWSVERRNPLVVVDSRLSSVENPFYVSGSQGVRCTKVVHFDQGSDVYIEFEAGAPGWTSGFTSALRFAAIPAESAWDHATNIESLAGAVVYVTNGSLYFSGTLSQSGLGTVVSPGVRAGLRLYDDNGTALAQWYVNGAAFGSAYTVAFGSYVAACAMAFGGAGNSNRGAILRADGDDQRFRPASSQPWGAAARVALVGGYSRPADGLDVAHASVTVYGRRSVTHSAAGFGYSARGTQTPSTQLRYVEFQVEALSAEGGAAVSVGLATTALDLGFQVGRFATGWGYRGNGTRYHNNSSVSVGVTYTVGDRPGVVWDPATGGVWFTKNGALLAGDPEAGTGAYYTNATGAIVPAVSPGNLGRVRVATHAREQLYRPSYAEAWDGADALPEQHYRGRLASEMEITTGVWFPWPWGGSRSGSPIGSVEVLNNDGAYDALRHWNLRDQSVAVYEPDGSQLGYAARALVDSAELVGERRARVLCRGVDALLDKRVERPIVAAGAVACAPTTPVEGESLSYNVSDSPLNVSLPFPLADLIVYDQGLSVSSHRRGDADKVRGFVRTVNPAGRQAVRNLLVPRRALDYALANNTFTTWPGDDPVSWTVVETPPNSNVTQAGSACRMIRNAGAPECSIRQSLGFNALGGGRVMVDLRISARTSGSLTVAVWTSSGTAVSKAANITSTGRFIVYLPWSSGPNATAFLRIYADDSTDLSIDSVEAYRIDSTTSLSALVSYVVSDLGGLGPVQWPTHASPSSSIFHGGIWSDQRPTVRQLLDELCASNLLGYYTDSAGRLTIVRLDVFNPFGGYWPLVSPVATLAANDVVGELSARDDLAPLLSDQVLWARNYARHSEAELAGGVSAAERAYLSSEGRVRRLNDGVSGMRYHPFYAGFANGAPPLKSLWSPANAQPTDIDLEFMPRLESCYVERRSFYECGVKSSRLRAIAPGQMVTLTHPRAGLPAGRNLMLVRKRRRAGAPVTQCLFWG